MFFRRGQELSVSQGELVLRIAIAAGAGLLLGLERELGGHPAGVRTHLLVAVGASLFTLAGGYGFDHAHIASMDPTRIGAQVASGIGFLGAGTIIQSGSSIRGLTTAATLWISGALGVAAAAGAYLPLATSLGVVLLALIGLSAAHPLLRRLSTSIVELSLLYEQGNGTLGPVVRGLAELDGRIDDITVDDDTTQPGLRHVSLRARIRDRSAIHELIATLQQRPEVRDVVLR
jgi:putative Mg2+ transporter-C (MgtC) family protein